MSCALPHSAEIIDVTARDGFQIVTDWIPTEAKKRILDQLAAAGVKRIEATSFVSPKAVPQLADAAAITVYMLEQHPQVETAVLAPNLRGAENAAAAGVRHINYVISASVVHNRENIRRTHAESLADLAAIVKALPSLTVNVALATVFGCPFTGCVPTAVTLGLIEEIVRQGVASVTLADTIGVANPAQVRFVLRAVRAAYPALGLRLHLHDTHGMGLANMAVALEEGITVFETAAGGMGGCPFAPGAAGNTATEDAVNMFHRMGVATGIDLEAYLAAVALIRESVPASLPGRLSVARSFGEFRFFDPRNPA
ncbi:hydroxymethylglutaryl-CoA lyase [Desulfovibrio sp. OttesenSCG-928-O18]|nr:hydroxymethylglutaryl-CoA lyase [Desulfovibrio sp. OttesenSCG-928-O18]